MSTFYKINSELTSLQEELSQRKHPTGTLLVKLLISRSFAKRHFMQNKIEHRLQLIKMILRWKQSDQSQKFFLCAEFTCFCTFSTKKLFTSCIAVANSSKFVICSISCFFCLLPFTKLRE